MALNRVIPGVVFIIISIVFFIETNNFPKQLGRDIGAAFWPRTLIVLLVIFSIWLIITGLIKKENSVAKRNFKITFGAVKPYLGMVIALGFVMFFNSLGYIVSVFIFYLLLAFTMHGRLNIRFLLISVIQATIIVLAIYLLFVKLLSVNLPLGVFA